MRLPRWAFRRSHSLANKKYIPFSRLWAQAGVSSSEQSMLIRSWPAVASSTCKNIPKQRPITLLPAMFLQFWVSSETQWKSRCVRAFYMPPESRGQSWCIVARVDGIIGPEILQTSHCAINTLGIGILRNLSQSIDVDASIARICSIDSAARRVN